MSLKRSTVKELLASQDLDREVLVKGWVRSRRGNKYVQFIIVNDGSTIHTIQAVADAGKFPEESLKDVANGACVAIRGQLVASQGKGQAVEIQATEITVLGKADAEEYPLQKKATSLEHLREIAHLRPRTNTFGAVLRVRHALAFAIHQLLQRPRLFLRPHAHHHRFRCRGRGPDVPRDHPAAPTSPR